MHESIHRVPDRREELFVLGEQPFFPHELFVFVRLDLRPVDLPDGKGQDVLLPLPFFGFGQSSSIFPEAGCPGFVTGLVGGIVLFEAGKAVQESEMAVPVEKTLMFMLSVDIGNKGSEGGQILSAYGDILDVGI